jgi:hypothetical protein
MNLSQRKITEGKPDTPAKFFLDPLDFPVRPPGIRAFVVAVLQDEAAACRTAEMIKVVVQGRESRLAPARQLIAHVGLLPVG